MWRFPEMRLSGLRLSLIIGWLLFLNINLYLDFFLEIFNQKNFFSGHPNLREFRQYFLFSLYLGHCHLRSLDWLILRWLMVALLSSPHSWPLIGQILAEAVRRSPHWLPLCPIAVASTRYSQPSHPLADSRAYRPPNFFLKILGLKKWLIGQIFCTRVSYGTGLLFFAVWVGILVVYQSFIRRWLNWLSLNFLFFIITKPLIFDVILKICLIDGPFLYLQKWLKTYRSNIRSESPEVLICDRLVSFLKFEIII